MFDKLEAVEARYEELTKLISDPEVIANQTEWQKLIKEHSSIEEVVLKFREYKKEKQRMDDAKEMMIKTLFVKFVQVQVEKKQHYLQVHYLECIRCMQKENIGKLKY